MSDINKPNGSNSTESAEKIKKYSFLVVDDDERVIRSNSRVLRLAHKGSEVRSADSGNRAIRIIEEGYIPDIIISDLSMPNGTGKDLYDWLKINSPELADRLMLVSGGIEGGIIGGRHIQELKAFIKEREEANRFERKPVSVVKLKEKIALILSVREGAEAVLSEDEPESDQQG